MLSFVSRALPFVLLMTNGCAPPKAPTAVELRPLEERRVQSVIERVVEEHGSTPKRGRTFELANGFRLKEDVQIGNGPYGIAYITAEERKDAGSGLPKYDPDNTALRVLHPSEDAIVLVLHDVAYRFNPAGNDTATAVAAEKTFERDVSDFIINVVATGAGRRKPAP